MSKVGDKETPATPRDAGPRSEALAKELLEVRKYLTSRLKEARANVQHYTAALEVAMQSEVMQAEALAQLDAMLDREGIARSQEAAAPAGGVEDPST